MKIVCDNCQLDFVAEAPAGDAVPLATCPHCGKVNGLARGSSAPSQGMRTCANCGRPAPADASGAVVICPFCQENEERTLPLEKEWMVRRQDGQIYGPFDLEVLESWLNDGKISARDEVAKVGGKWKRFEEHARFSRHFASQASTEQDALASAVAAADAISVPPPSPPPASPTASLQPKGIDWAYALGNVAAVLGMLLAVVGSYALIEGRWLVLPQDWIEAGKGGASWVIDTVRGNDEDMDFLESGFSAYLLKLRQRHPRVTEASSTLFVRGRGAFLRDTKGSLRQARALLEQAVVANPADDLALSALAEVYGTIEDSDLQKEGLRLLDRAARLNPGSAEVLRARAAVSVGIARPEKAREDAEAALRLNPKDGEAELYVGMSYLGLATPDYKQALEHFAKAVKVAPRLHKAWHQTGLVYLKQKQYRKAQAAFQKKIELDPTNPSARADMARLLEEVGDAGQAIGWLEQAWRIDQTDDPAIGLELAVLLYEARGQTGQARALLTSLTPEKPVLSLSQHKEALSHLAAVEHILGNHKQGLAAAERALAVDPYYAPALFQKGLCLLSLDKLDDAGRTLRAASATDVGKEVQAAIHFYLSRILLEQDKGKKAQEELEEAVDAWPGEPYYYLALTQQHLVLSEEEDAFTSARALADQDPLYARDRFRRTLYFHQLPRGDGWVGAFQKLINDRPYVAEHHAMLGMLLWRLGRTGEAWQAFQEALENSQDNVTALLNLGLMSYAQGNFRGALDYFNQVLERDAQRSIAFLYQGLSALALGDLKLADDGLQKALAYRRKNAVLLNGLGQLAARKGEKDKARGYLLQALELDPSYLAPRRGLYQLGL